MGAVLWRTGLMLQLRSDLSNADAAGLKRASALAERTYDAVIVGTGMGGAILGRRLVEAGLEVLFLEKGHGRFVYTNATHSTTTPC